MDQSYAGDLIGFTTGLLLSLTLLVLAIRASRFGGAPASTIAFGACALLWSGGGLANSALLAIGRSDGDIWLRLTQALHYAGAAAGPLPILATWRSTAGSAGAQSRLKLLYVPACLFALAIPIWVMTGFARLAMLRHMTSLGAAAVLVAGAAVGLRRGVAPRAIYLPSIAILVTVSGAALLLMVIRSRLFYFIGSHVVPLVVICSFLLFARFRYADRFLRYGVRILLAGLWATLLIAVTQLPLVWTVAAHSASPGAMHVLLVILLANLLLLSFTIADEWLSVRAVRWLFRPPDYRTEIRRLTDRLRAVADEPDVAETVAETVRGTLDLGEAEVVPFDTPAPVGLAEGEVIDRGRDLLIPITSAGRVSHLLRALPGPARPCLVSSDVDYLRAVAAQCGIRFDSLQRERETAERQTREANLLQQVTEAELRALRAQINPHFLFNSLNTIADLTVRDPARAEAMTVRLASVFRHLLAHSNRPLTTVGEELDFLRTYLYIEEVRFADRLRVEIAMAPETADQEIPSLLLQPLVENALKHGLAPRTAPGRLWISADLEDGGIRLAVEDDGMGIGAPADAGTGLANVRDRLRTLYGDRAVLTVEPRRQGGTRATVSIPRSRGSPS